MSGSTVRDLELQWEAGQSFPRAIIRSLKQGRHLNLLTFAGILVALVVIDGPLLQRASTVQLATLNQPVTMDVELSPELPHGFSGTWYPGDALSVNDALSLVYGQYTRSASLTGGDSKADQVPIRTSAYCSGECRATVRAPGIARTDCVNKTWPITEKMLRDPSSAWGSGGVMPSKSIFYTEISLYGVNVYAGSMRTPGREAALLTTGVTNYESCSGQYVETNCTLSSAVLEYDVVIRGHEMTFETSAASGRVVAEANNTFFNESAKAPQDVTLMGIMLLLQPSISANASLSHTVSKGYLTDPAMDTLNLFAMQHFETSLMQTKCDVRFSDPTNDIVSMFNSILFRAGVLTGKWRNTTHLLDEGLSVHQTVQAQQMEKQNIFHSDLRWFAGAAAIQCITIMLILPVFWGWWNIGVELTLSPFQTAKMLDAPILKDVNSAAGATGISNDIGDRKVKFGLVEVYEPIIPTNTEGKLSSGVAILTGSRIGITDPQGVVRPRKGMRFTY